MAVNRSDNENDNNSNNTNNNENDRRNAMRAIPVEFEHLAKTTEENFCPVFSPSIRGTLVLSISNIYFQKL